MYQNIRPQKCLAATKLLLRKDLYKSYVLNGIDTAWITKHIPEMRQTEWAAFIHSNEAELHHNSSHDAQDVVENDSECQIQDKNGKI